MANTIRPKLVLSNASGAIDFYRQALDADVTATYRMGDAVVFAELEVLGTTITLKDGDDSDRVPEPGRRGPILDVVVDDPDAVAARLIEHGAEIVFPIAEQPYGARGGRLADPYGVQWLLQTPVEMTPRQWDDLVAGMGDDG